MTRRARRWIIGFLAVLLAIPVLGYVALLAVVRSDAIRPRVQEAVTTATGRAFTLSGPIGLAPSLVPRITLEGPSLANIPGGSRPDMLRARRIEAEVALIPLLSRRVEVRSLTIIGPDLLLETDAEGRPNWRPGPAARPEVVAPPTGAPAAPSRPLALDVASLTIEDGRVTWRGAPGANATEVIEVPRLVVRAAGAEAGTRMEGRVAARGMAATVGANTGPLAPLLRGPLANGTGEPWPFRIALSAEGMNAEASGTLDLPVTPTGWRARLALTADSTARFAALLPGVALPPARGLSGVMEVDGAGGIRSAHLAANEVALPPAFGGATLAPIQVSAASPDAPVAVVGTAQVRGMSLALNGAGPNLAALRDAGAAWPVSGNLSAEGLWLEGAATVSPGLRAGRAEPVEGTAVLRVTDFPAVAARFGVAAPSLHDAALDARWRLAAEGTEVPEFTLRAREAVGGGSVSVRRADPVPAILARLAFERLDLDALRAGSAAAAGAGAGRPNAPSGQAGAPAQPSGPGGPAPPQAQAGAAPVQPAVPAAPSGGAGGGSAQAPVGNAPTQPAVPAAPQAQAGAGASPAPPSSGGAAGERRVIPDMALPVAALRTLPVSADVVATVGALRAGGADWRSVSVTAKAGGGRVVLEPVSAESPGGALAGAVSADASGERPALALALRSAGAGVDLGPLMEAFGVAAPLRGRARLDVALRGGGDGLRAVLGSLDGHAALSMGAGTVDPALVARLTAPLRGVVPEGALGNATALRCLELRFGVAGGVATAENAVLRTGIGGATAAGSVNLRDETLALRLNPVVRVGSVSVTTPVTVGGSFAAPRVSVDRGGAAAGVAGLLGGLARRSGDEGTAALGALAEELAGGEASVPGCESAGAVPAPRAGRPGVGDVLRGLLGR